MTVTGAQLQEFLAGLDYPVSREDLVRWGQENGAGTEALQALRSLPAEEFQTPTELGEALVTLADA
ncbi:DUF2795 domain-containing protein [Micromonospora chalcea]|uniref:DUF2795 domain-containing protein n=1 Tax=Micromonospora chalcea TaxID=1874 RepID=UPI0004C2B5A4|nr:MULTISPECIES: DUF2795 domain-containing protein [Micromonospora]MCT2279690.1 DUF2795 domain-containing protein [Micromonospora chalcea]